MKTLKTKYFTMFAIITLMSTSLISMAQKSASKDAPITTEYSSDSQMKADIDKRIERIKDFQTKMDGKINSTKNTELKQEMTDFDVKINAFLDEYNAWSAKVGSATQDQKSTDRDKLKSDYNKLHNSYLDMKQKYQSYKDNKSSGTTSDGSKKESMQK